MHMGEQTVVSVSVAVVYVTPVWGWHYITSVMMSDTPGSALPMSKAGRSKQVVASRRHQASRDHAYD